MLKATMLAVVFLAAVAYAEDDHDHEGEDHGVGTLCGVSPFVSILAKGHPRDTPANPSTRPRRRF